MNNPLTYEKFQALAREYYRYGGDVVVECWGRDDFEDYVREVGPITILGALEIFKLYNSRWNDIQATIW